MLEKDIKKKFVEEWLGTFQNLLGVKNLRLYSTEFPVRTPDGTKYADIVLEIDNHEIWSNNILIVMEWKKDKIDTGVVEQVLRYSSYIGKQLYRKKEVLSFIAGPDFSNWELKMCKEHNVHPLQFDLRGNMEIL